MIAAIIQARMSSTRLPGKVLLPINGRPMLSYMIERVAAAKRIDYVLIATSEEVSDDPIAAFCRREGIQCYRGSLDDLLDRYYQAASQIGCDTVVRLTSDCPLIDPNVIDTVIGRSQSHPWDYVANTAPPEGSTFPDGMDVEVFSFEALEAAWKAAGKPSEREHVTFYFWKNPDLFSTHRYDLAKDLSGYRLTVDYPEDFEVIRSICAALYPKNPRFEMADIIRYLEQNTDVLTGNSHIIPNQGWQPALEKDKLEALRSRDGGAIRGSDEKRRQFPS